MMIEPVQVQQLMIATLSAGAMVLFAACYALFLALGRFRSLRALRRVAGACYAAFVAFTATLAWALRLDGVWLALIGILLIGYYAAPRAIWRLSVATHETHENPASGSPPSAGDALGRNSEAAHG